MKVDCVDGIGNTAVMIQDVVACQATFSTYSSFGCDHGLDRANKTNSVPRQTFNGMASAMLIYADIYHSDSYANGRRASSQTALFGKIQTISESASFNFTYAA